jgi:hypothetical protein
MANVSGEKQKVVGMLDLQPLISKSSRQDAADKGSAEHAVAGDYMVGEGATGHPCTGLPPQQEEQEGGEKEGCVCGIGCKRGSEDLLAAVVKRPKGFASGKGVGEPLGLAGDCMCEWDLGVRKGGDDEGDDSADLVGLEPGGPPGRDGTYFNPRQQEPSVRLLLQDQSRAVTPASAGGTKAAGVAATAIAAGSWGGGGTCGDIRQHTSVPVGSRSYVTVPAAIVEAATAGYTGKTDAPPLQPGYVNDANSTDATTPIAGTEAAVPGVPAAGVGGSKDAPALVDFWEAVAHVMQLCDDLKVRLGGVRRWSAIQVTKPTTVFHAC